VIVRFGTGNDPSIADTERFDRLSVALDGPLAGVRWGEFGLPDPDGSHVWLTIAALRDELARTGADDEALAQFDGMIDYATAKGWADPGRGAVRAHVAAD
jgi:hypothetical protein